jgi:2-keto-3-deoxy-L-rhamnonate aldolase RhmA
MDLSLSYGLESPRYDHPEFLGAFDRVLAAAKKWGKPAGMFTLLDNVEWAIEKGFTLITVDSADISLVRGARMALKKANNGDRSRF